MQAELAEKKRISAEEPVSALDEDEPLILEGERTVSVKTNQIVSPPSLDDINENMALDSASSEQNDWMSDLLSSEDLSFDENDTLPEPELSEITDMLGDPSASAENQTDLTDEDEPVSLSNEELDGILEDSQLPEEEFSAGTEVPDSFSALSEDTSQPSSESFFNDDSEGPITLSDEELDGILVDSPAGMAPDDQHSETFDNEPALEPEPELISDMPQGNASGEQTISNADFFEADDDEPIALSDDELDNILADAEAGHEDFSESVPPDLAGAEPVPPATEVAAVADNFFESDEDEPITLSESELDNILEEAHHEEPADIELPGDEMALSEDTHQGTVPIDDDEGPIALSSEELDGILDSGSEPEPNDFTQADVSDETENEPIALSNEELDGILEDAHDIGEQPGEAELPAGFDTDFDKIDSLPDTMPDFADPVAGALPEITAEPDGSLPSFATDDDQEEIISLPPLDSSSGSDFSGDMAFNHDEASAPLLADEDNEPTALSNEELEGILGDSNPTDISSDMNDFAETPGLPPADSVVFEEDLNQSQLVPAGDKVAATDESPIAEDKHDAENLPPRDDLRKMIGYLDNLLGELPDDVIEKFAQSEYFKLYQKMMEQLDL